MHRSYHAPVAACDRSPGGLRLHGLLSHWHVLRGVGLPRLLLPSARAGPPADAIFRGGHRRRGPRGVLLCLCSSHPCQPQQGAADSYMFCTFWVSSMLSSSASLWSAMHMGMCWRSSHRHHTGNLGEGYLAPGIHVHQTWPLLTCS